MSKRFQRALSLLAGLAAIPTAVVLPLLFLSNEFQEAESANQWGGHPSAGVIKALLAGVVLIGVAFAGGVGFVAYRLLRFALMGSKPS